MPVSKHVLRVFLSSPVDVGRQRDIVRSVITAMNADPLVARRCALEVVAWDTEGAAVPLSAIRPPQDSVNAYVPMPRECDLTIILLRGRLGTPLPPGNRRADGTVYESGTVWELEDARSARREVFVYRYKAPKVALDDPEKEQKEEQYRRLTDFVKGFLCFGVHECRDDQHLTKLVSEHLRQFVDKAAPWEAPKRNSVPIVSGVSVEPQLSPAELFDGLERLIHLCDRENVRNEFISKLRERILREPGRGLLCILPGEKRECHQGFLERVRAYEVSDQIPDVKPEQVMLARVSGTLSLDTAKKLGDSILFGIRQRVCNAEVECWEDLSQWMDENRCRIFILAVEPTIALLRGKERMFLAHAAAWLSAWVDKPDPKLFVLVACVRYKSCHASVRLTSEQERICQIVKNFTPLAPTSAVVPRVFLALQNLRARFTPLARTSAVVPDLVKLTELLSITRDDIEEWLDHKAVRQAFGSRLKVTIDQLLEKDRKVWTMDDLRDVLAPAGLTHANTQETR